jgi:hypothetical protein
MPLTTTRYAGHEAIEIESGAVRLVVTTSVGPRVLALITGDGVNAFAELPDMTLTCPGSGAFHLYGGHRLWAAPEDPRVTYRPDDDPVEVTERPDGLSLRTLPDPVAGTSRETTVRVTGSERFAFDYRVVNTSDRAQRLACWAITMMAPGGRAWMPLLTEPFDAGGFQAQRNIVCWPYTRMDDPRLVLTDMALEIRADRGADLRVGGNTKVGTSLRRGWVAHWGAGVLLVKRAGHDETREYADMGASAQVYSQPEFTELETLGPLVDLAPGESAQHREDWEVYLVDEVEAERLVTSGELDGTKEAVA